MTHSFCKRVFSPVLTAVALSALALGAFSAALAQAVPPSSLNGDWKNVDPHTRGIDVILINGKKIHPFGTCHPTDCDWGVLKLKAKRIASSGNSVYISKWLAKDHIVAYGHDPLTGLDYDDRQVKTTEIIEITLALLPDGRLRVDRFTRFTDKSGRAAYRAVDYFRRDQSPTAP
jgi:hypothetical protein